MFWRIGETDESVRVLLWGFVVCIIDLANAVERADLDRRLFCARNSGGLN
jgi:hypothetical protein